MRVIQIYTDGGCLGNPGPGAWAALAFEAGFEESLKEWSGRAAGETTNNRMELTAMLEGLSALPKNFPGLEEGAIGEIGIYTDSQYVKNGVESWMAGWKKNGWLTKNKKPVKNRDLWESLDKAVQQLERQSPLRWFWIKGHAGNIYNERCDILLQKLLR